MTSGVSLDEGGFHILVTGGAGFIGSNFVRHVLRERPGWLVTNLDKLTYAGNLENLAGLDGHPRHRFVRGDIADRELVRRLFRGEPLRGAGGGGGAAWPPVDAVVSFAAEYHVDRSILDPAPFVETNVKGTRLILRLLGKPDSLIAHVADRPGHDWRYAIDPARTEAELGWRPRRGFEEALAETVRWYVENRGWWERVRSGEYLRHYEAQYGPRLRGV